MGLTDAVIIIIYFAVLILIGYIGLKKVKCADDFLTAGRSLKMFRFFPSMCALLLGGTSTIGTAALGYRYGISGIWIVTMLGLGVLLAGLFMMKRVRKMKVYTVAQFLTVRYSAVAGYACAVVSGIYAMMVCVTQIIATGTILQVIMGWNMMTAMIVAGVVTILYTMLGGMCAITFIELIQFGFIVFGILIVLVPNALNRVGGMTVLMNSLPKSYFQLFSIGPLTVIKYFFLYCMGAMVGQDVWQKFFTAKDDRVVKWGGVQTFLFVVIYAVCCALVGMCGRVLFPKLENPQLVFSFVTSNVLKTGWLGITLAGILSVLLSSASGLLLAASSLVMNDIIRPLRSKKASEKQMINQNRIAIVIIGIVSVFIAIKLDDVLVSLDVAYSVLSGALFLPIVLGIFWKRATRKAAITAIAVSSIVVLVGMKVYGLSSVWPIIFGLVIGLILMIVVSLTDKKQGSISDER